MPAEPQLSGTPLVNSTDRYLPQSAASANQAEPPLFRFHLRQLLWFVAIVSALLAAIVSLPGLPAAALLLAALVVGAHVFSTALASRLRSQTEEAQRFGVRAQPTSVALRAPTDAERGAASLMTERSPWHRRGSTSLPWLPRLIVAGVVVGAIAGALLLAVNVGHRTSVAGILVGSASLAVVGGWFAFLCGSFYGIFRHGLRDALAEQLEDELPRPVSR